MTEIYSERRNIWLENSTTLLHTLQGAIISSQHFAQKSLSRTNFCSNRRISLSNSCWHITQENFCICNQISCKKKALRVMENLSSTIWKLIITMEIFRLLNKTRMSITLVGLNTVCDVNDWMCSLGNLCRVYNNLKNRTLKQIRLTINYFLS
jgi:hypothetical protein